MNNKSDTASATRRTVLQTSAAIAVLSGCKSNSASSQTNSKFTTQWNTAQDRIFLGGQMWANPMEDWLIKDGAAITRTSGPARNIQLITHQLTNALGNIEMTLTLKRLNSGEVDGGAGFRVGVKSDINEYRANAFAKTGIVAGVFGTTLAIGPSISELSKEIGNQAFTLKITNTPKGSQSLLTLSASTLDGELLGEVSSEFETETLIGNVALVHNFAIGKQESEVNYAFEKWEVDGSAFTVKPERSFGPIMWSMYAISDSRSDEGRVFKMSVLTAPLGEQDNRDIELQVKRNGEWVSQGTATLDTDAWTAVFRIANWDSTKALPYRAIYKMKQKDGSETPHEWTGIIQAEPKGRPLRLAALTCQKDYSFPYEPIAKNVAA